MHRRWAYDCQSHGGNGERSRFPVKVGKQSRIRGEVSAGQSKQLLSNLVYLQLILEGCSNFMYLAFF